MTDAEALQALCAWVRADDEAPSDDHHRRFMQVQYSADLDRWDVVLFVRDAEGPLLGLEHPFTVDAQAQTLPVAVNEALSGYRALLLAPKEA